MPFKKQTLHLKQELGILEADIISARKFLRKNRKTYFNNKKNIPLYLLLGPSRFGKTTILSQAGLKLKNFHSQSLNEVTPTKYCSFWFSQEGLYIDTAGNYTKPDITDSENDLIWQNFIKLINKHFGKNAISGALIILDLPAIIQDTDILKSTLLCVRRRIYELSAFVYHVPLYIIFTKCDKISGFNQFFHTLSAQERAKPFGIAFTEEHEKINPIPVFETKLNELLKRINTKVIECLQKATTANERLLIKSFPSQLNSITKILFEVLDKIPSGNKVNLSGMYFTSSAQYGASIDIIKNAHICALDLKEKQNNVAEYNNRNSYFIEDIFKKIITSAGNKKTHKNNNRDFWLSVCAVILITSVVIASSVIGYKSYYKNLEIINNIKSSDPDNIQAIINKLEQDSKSIWLKLGVNKAKSIANSLHTDQQIIAAKTILSALEKHISTIIVAPESAHDSRKIYDALKAYLMLGEHKKINPTFIKSWLNNNISKNIISYTKLEESLKNKHNVQLNQHIISFAREHLNNLPAIDLIYLLLENSYNYKNQEIYNHQYCNIVYDTSIPDLVKKLPKQDWVLGSNLQLDKKIKSSADAIKNLRDLYLDKYVLVLEKSLANPKIEINQNNIHQATKDLIALSSENSPIIKSLKEIRYNNETKNMPAIFVKTIKTKLQTYNDIDIKNLQTKLRKFADQFELISKKSDTGLWAFDALTGKILFKDIQSFADSEPIPVQVWVQTIIKNIHPVLLHEASIHIDKKWNAIVVSEYKNKIFNKYPLFKNNDQDIKLNDFNSFFGPNGTMESFFNKYILPFADIESNNWVWKNIENCTISIPQEHLEVFLRANLIQKMFYPNKTPNPQAAFTLSPMDLSPNTQSFNMYLEGQKVTFNYQDKQSHNLVWPGPSSGLITMDFTDIQGKYFSASTFGPWALFRLMDKSNISQANNLKNFTLIFELNGNVAKYELTAKESVNPFIPGIISDFRCPDSLY